MDRTLSSVSPRGLLALLCAMGLLCRLMMPSGFMPALTSQGIAIQLCDGRNDQAISLDLTKKSSRDDHRLGGDVCPFAASAASHSAVMPAFDVELPVACLAFLVADIAKLGSGPVGLAAPPPPAIGQPSAV